MGNKPKILIVDDEVPIRRFLRASLPEADYDVIEAASGEEGIRHVASYAPDVILLDLGLPDKDGVDVTMQIREWSAIPIIILSARSDEVNKVKALDAGANDYLTKPFGLGELLARIRVCLRLAKRAESGCAIFEHEDLKVDFGTRRVFKKDTEVHLTPIEYKLLTHLVQHAGKVLTHRQLLVSVWGEAYARENHYLRVFMGQLRHKLESDPAQPKYLTTEPGVGYRFKVD